MDVPREQRVQEERMLEVSVRGGCEEQEWGVPRCSPSLDADSRLSIRAPMCGWTHKSSPNPELPQIA